MTLEFSRDVIWRLVCPRCGARRALCRGRQRALRRRRLPRCDGQRRVVETIHGYSGSGAWGSASSPSSGCRCWISCVARSAEREIGYLPEGDRKAVLGAFADKRDKQT